MYTGIVQQPQATGAELVKLATQGGQRATPESQVEITQIVWYTFSFRYNIPELQAALLRLAAGTQDDLLSVKSVRWCSKVDVYLTETFTSVA